MYNVLLVDDNAILNIGFSVLIKEAIENADIKIVESITEMEQAVTQKRYQILIVGLPLETQKQFERIGCLAKENPPVSILVLSENWIELPRAAILKSGVCGILDKRAGVEAFRRAILEIKNSGYYLDNELFFPILKSPKDNMITNYHTRLSKREKEVASLMLEGKKIIQISQLMQLRQNTISTFKKRIYEKLKVNNIIELNYFKDVIVHTRRPEQQLYR